MHVQLRTEWSRKNARAAPHRVVYITGLLNDVVKSDKTVNVMSYGKSLATICNRKIRFQET